MQVRLLLQVLVSSAENSAQNARATHARDSFCTSAPFRLNVCLQLLAADAVQTRRTYRFKLCTQLPFSAGGEGGPRIERFSPFCVPVGLGPVLQLLLHLAKKFCSPGLHTSHTRERTPATDKKRCVCARVQTNGVRVCKGG